MKKHVWKIGLNGMCIVLLDLFFHGGGKLLHVVLVYSFARGSTDLRKHPVNLWVIKTSQMPGGISAINTKSI